MQRQAHAHQVLRRLLEGSGEGRYLRLGIRVRGMGAVSDAWPRHRTGPVPYCASYAGFSIYLRTAIRLAATTWRTAGMR